MHLVETGKETRKKKRQKTFHTNRESAGREGHIGHMGCNNTSNKTNGAFPIVMKNKEHLGLCLTATKLSEFQSSSKLKTGQKMCFGSMSVP